MHVFNSSLFLLFLFFGPVVWLLCLKCSVQRHHTQASPIAHSLTAEQLFVCVCVCVCVCVFGWLGVVFLCLFSFFFFFTLLFSFAVQQRKKATGSEGHFSTFLPPPSSTDMMQDDRAATTASATPPSLLLRTGDNQVPAHVNAVGGMPASLSHPSQLQVDGYPTGDMSPSEPHSSVLGVGVFASTADPAGSSFHTSVAAAPITGSEDGGPHDGKSQARQSMHIHSPTSPTADLVQSNDFTAENTSASLSAPHTTSRPAITVSSSCHPQGTKAQQHARAQKQPFTLPEGSFLAADAAAEEKQFSALAPSRTVGRIDESDSMQQQKQLERRQRAARDGAGASLTSSSTSSFTSTTSASSAPSTAAVTLCHDTKEGSEQSPMSELPLPATTDRLSTSTSMSSSSSFTASSTFTVASPYPTTHTSKASSGGKATTPATQQSTSAAAAAERSVANVSDSTDSPLISLESDSKIWTSSFDHHSSVPSTSGQQSLESPPPLPLSSRVIRGSRSGKTAIATTSSSGSGGAGTASSGVTTAGQSSHLSFVTLDSAVACPRGSNLTGMRVLSPVSQVLPPDAVRPPPSLTLMRREMTGSPPSFARPPLTTLTRLSASASASNGFACTTFFGLPAFMNAASNTSLAAFPKLDVSLGASMAAAAASSSGTAERDSRPGSGGATANDEGRDSHGQLRRDSRTVGNSSLHSPPLSRQSSHGFTVTTTSFACDTPCANARTPRTHTSRQSSMHDSAVSLYHSSSMLSDNILQTLTHGMALGGASTALWRSVISSNPASPRLSHAGPLPTDSSISLYASQNSDNNAYVRYPFGAHWQHHFRRRASQPLQASMAVGTAFPLYSSSLTGASHLYGSSMTGTEVDGSELRHPFLASMCGLSAVLSHHASQPVEQPVPAASPAAVSRRVRMRRSCIGQRWKTVLDTADVRVTAVPPSTLHAADRDTPIQELSTPSSSLPYVQQQHQSPSSSSSFFAAADDAMRYTSKFGCSRPGDYSVVRDRTSLMTPYGGWHASATRRSTRSVDSHESPLQLHAAASAVTRASSANSMLVHYGPCSAEDSNAEQLRRRSGHSSGVAPTMVSADTQAVFLRSVHAAAAAVDATGVPAGGNGSALRHFFLGGSPPTPSRTTASIPFSSSFAGSTGGKGVCRGDGPSPSPSMVMVTSSTASSGAQPHSAQSPHVSEDGPATGLPDAQSADQQQQQRDAATVTTTQGGKAKDAAEASCSPSGSPQRGPAPPLFLAPATAATAPSLSNLSNLAAAAPAATPGGVISDGASHLLPWVEREHVSVSGSCRFPTLGFLGTSDHHRWMARTRRSTMRHSRWAGYRGSQPHSTTANRGLFSPELTQRSLQSTQQAERRSEGRYSSPAAAEQGAVLDPQSSGLNGADAIATTAATDGGRADVIQMESAGRLSIPSFHHHRDVESMLDDAETMMRRVRVPIVPVLNSKMTRGLDPNLSSTLHGQSDSSLRTSVLSLQTPPQTVSADGSETQHVSASMGSAEKKQLSDTFTDTSITISSGPFGMHEPQ